MNLSNLTDAHLLSQAEKAAAQERLSLTNVLHHLREIERRRLFSSVRCTSLFDYAIKRLGYSEDEAARRISAMRLLKALPQIENKIQQGKVSLTTLNMAQTLFRQESKTNCFSDEKKIAVLEKLENKSTREAAKVLQDYSSVPPQPKPEKMRLLSEDKIEVYFVISPETEAKIQKLRGLLAHSNPRMSLSELIDKLCDLGLQKWDPERKKPKKIRFVPPYASREKTAISGWSENDHKPEKVFSSKVESPAAELAMSGPSSRFINAKTRRNVWLSTQSKCQNCGSQFALQIDHVWPRALGGSHDAGNLRLLCRTCNQKAAIEVFGIKKMEKYLNSQ